MMWGFTDLFRWGCTIFEMKWGYYLFVDYFPKIVLPISVMMSLFVQYSNVNYSVSELIDIFKVCSTVGH